VQGAKDDSIHVIRYDDHALPMQSPPVTIDFYSLSLKEYADGPRNDEGSTEGLL
jgi:hypothetical protein